MSDIVLSEDNLKKLIDVLSKSDIGESEKTELARELNQLIVVYSEIQEQQTLATQLLVKAKE